MVLHAKFGLIWTTPWPDKKDLFLKLLIWKDRKFPYEKLIFFPRQAIQRIPFALHFHYTCDSPYNSSRYDFYIIENRKSEKVDISNWNTKVFSMKVRRTIFLSQSLPTLRILHTKFGLIWRISWPDKKDLFLKFFFRETQKFPYEILTFFLGKLYQKVFVLHSNYTCDTPCRVWFDLNNSLTR